MIRTTVEIWHAGHPSLALLNGAVVSVPAWMIETAYRPILTHNPSKPITPGQYDWEFEMGDMGLESLIREYMTPRPAYLWRPGDACPCSGCDGEMELERHLEGCSCVPWENPCSYCLREVFGNGGGGRPWVICDTCDWMEEDGGISNHAILSAHERLMILGKHG